MHIRSVVVRNYRVHRELAISFDRKLTLIGGPNEVGKSTLAEAIHRGLFLKSKVTGESLSPMKSNVGDGVPEIEVEFQKGDAIYRIHKKFSGANGTTRLSQVNGKTWQGDEAESRLADILEVEQVGGGRGIGERVGQQWAHLWVWQGQSGTDPSTYATAQRDSLLSRLQSGAAVIMQSELDSKVAKSFMEMVTEEFSAKKEPKAKSPIARARQEFNDAKSGVENSEEQCRKLQNAADEFRRAGQEWKDAEARLTVLQSDLSELNKKLEMATKLEGDISKKKSLISQDEQKIRELQKAGRAIDEAGEGLRKIQSALQPARLKEIDLVNAEKYACEVYVESDQQYLEACETANQALGKFELAAAVQNHFRVSADLCTCIESQKVAEQIHEKLAETEARLLPLPDISDVQIRRLRTLSQNRGEADATLKAIATGIELIVADQSVLVGDNELQAHSPLVITEVTEICIGSGVRLLVRPGGGDGVTTAKQKLQEIELQIQQELISIGVTSLLDSEQSFQDRQEFSRQKESLKGELRLLNADTLSQRIETLRSEQKHYAQDIERRIRILNISLDVPETTEDVTGFITRCKEAREQAEATVELLKTGRNVADENRIKARDSVSEYKRELQRLRDEETSLGGKLQGLIQASGDAEKRKAQLEEFEKTKAAAGKEVAELESTLRELEPDELGGKKNRLERALEGQQAAKTLAGETQAVARNILQSQGVTDPQEQLASAKAKLAQAEERLQIEDRQGKAKLLLSDLFHAEQQKHSARFTQPLVTKVADYLRPVFGRSIDVQLNNENLKFTGLGLNRRDNNQGAVDFDSLSAGAREQLAAAVRLAIAELLAEGSDGCLPIVFDDAFAYSDPDRVEGLQAMLDLAANRGLQVIVLTCNPRDYYRLGASEVTLSANRTSSNAGSSTPPIQRSTAAPLSLESRQPNTSPRSASRTDMPATEYQSSAKHLAATDAADAPSEIAGDNFVHPVEMTPVADRTENQTVALRWGSDPTNGVEMPTVLPTGAKPTERAVNSGQNDPRASQLLEKLQQLGGTAAKSALRLELGMSFGDFTSLLQDMLQTRLIREDRTKIKVSLVNN